jgi:lipoprotein NlpI
MRLPSTRLRNHTSGKQHGGVAQRQKIGRCTRITTTEGALRARLQFHVAQCYDVWPLWGLAVETLNQRLGIEAESYKEVFAAIMHQERESMQGQRGAISGCMG